MLVTLTEGTEEGQPIRTEINRIVYRHFALKDISASDRVFKENYTGSDPVLRLQHWYGSEQEIVHRPNGSYYDVLFPAKAGENKTIVTGVNFTFPQPAKIRRGLGMRFNLAPNEESVSYPNETDFICEMMILVDSPTLKLAPVAQAAKRAMSNGQSAETGADHRFGEPHEPVAVVARWKDVKPGEEVGVYLRW